MEGENLQNCKFCQKSFPYLKLHEVNCKSKPSTKGNEEKAKTEGSPSKAEGSSSYAERSSSKAEGSSSKAEGSSSKAEGSPSKAERSSSKAEGSSSKAEGSSSKAERSSSKAEGSPSKAEGSPSKAEGSPSKAEGSSSQAEGSSSSTGKSKLKHCPYCQKPFRRLDLHQPHCESKPKEQESKTSIHIGDSKEGPCPFCQKDFKHLDLHQPKCKSKPLTREEEEEENEEEEEKEEENEEEEKHEEENEEEEKKEEEKGAKPKMKQCQFCKKAFKRLDMHLPKCLSNPDYNKGPGKKRGQVMLDRFLEELKPKRSGPAPDVEKINDVMDKVVRKLNDSRPLNWKIIKSGSYYSHLKIDKPDEYDYMMCPTKIKCRIEQSEENPCYCRVFVTNKTNIPIEFREILKDDNELTPTKFREYVFKVFDLYLKENCRNRRMSRVDTQETCPAYTVKYSYGNIYADIDWVPCLKVDEYPRPYAESIERHSDLNLTTKELYVVPKTLATAEGRRDLWRVSYSMIEKEIICNVYTLEHRKIVKALKKILKETKKDDDEDRKLCSYHVLSHCLSFFKNNQMGKEEEDFYSHCYDVMRALIDRLKLRTLGHYFIPNFNLLEDVTDEEATEFIERLQYYLGEWSDMSDGGADDDDEDGGDDGAAAACTADDGAADDGAGALWINYFL